MVVCMCTCTCLPFNICIENYEHDLKIYISLSILTSIFLVQLTLTYQYLSEKKKQNYFLRNYTTLCKRGQLKT